MADTEKKMLFKKKINNSTTYSTLLPCIAGLDNSMLSISFYIWFLVFYWGKQACDAFNRYKILPPKPQHYKSADPSLTNVFLWHFYHWLKQNLLTVPDI